MTAPQTNHWRIPFFILLLFPIAFALDVPVARWVHDSGLAAAIERLPRPFAFYVLRFFGIWVVVVAAALALWIDDLRMGRNKWPRLGRRSAVVVLAGIFSLSNVILKWVFGRLRPYHGVPPFQLHPFPGGMPGLFHSRQGLSFPSGDVTLAFAMTATLCYTAPKFKVVWWILGIWIMLQRIAAGAHYPSDTVGGMALGLFVGWLARRIIDRLAPDRAGEPA